MSKTYIKKPVTVTAEQWFPDKPVEGVSFARHKIVPGLPEGATFSSETGVVETIFGPSIVSPGDWVVTEGRNIRVIPADKFAEQFEEAPVTESTGSPALLLG
jgi:hypothetical protein